ncbi:DKNYY domain-containing protein [Pseudoalteromonas sp. McH1-42]|uniref:DKNYY domain-containing protein n=1 Tax=Pseudoalteromonas sp. McH1-42 TaxID=2917752 RepID=UPI001EF69A20|nr:DKNYY domain-containing protein [Pseudoalteromonas sp. McH1-42]MCG7562565.1 DKNYY domain-containing protein [Pseudoalteromonas sp. McH1-42]
MTNRLLLLLTALMLVGCNTTAPERGYIVNTKTNQVLYGDRIGLGGQTSVTRSLNNVDPATFEVIDRFGYAKDKHLVFKSGGSIPFADPATFRKLSQYYAADKRYVYFKGEIVRGANPDNVRVIDDKWNYRGYLLSDNKVYLGTDKVFTPCDIDTFKVFDVGGFAKDRECVFFEGERVTGASAKSFRGLYIDYGADHQHVYYQTKRVKGLNVKDFRKLSAEYAKDKKHIYFQDQVTTISPEGFRVVDGGYAKNDQHVFYQGNILPGADPDTFRVYYLGVMGKDKAHCYYEGKITECGDWDESMSVQEPQQQQILLKRLLEIQNKSLAKNETELPARIRDLKLALNHRYLTPDNVNDIDLSKLPIGFHFRWIDTSLADRSVMYELRSMENDIATFALHSNNLRGALFEKRSRDGKVLSDSEMKLSAAFSYQYTPSKCLYKLGKCEQEITPLVTADALTNSLLQLSPENPQGKLYLNEQIELVKLQQHAPAGGPYHISYDDGIWTRIDERGDKELFMFDEFGLPVLHFREQDGQPVDLWYRKFEPK